MTDTTKVFKVVFHQTGLIKDQLLSKNKSKDLVFGRMLFTALMRKEGYSFTAIGRELKRDHTTIINSYRNAENNAKIKDIIENKKRYWQAVSLNPIVKQLSNGRYSNIYELYKNKCAVSTCSFDEVIEIHHIVSLKNGGSDDPENLIVFCPNHHALADRGMLKIKELHIEN